PAPACAATCIWPPFGLGQIRQRWRTMGNQLRTELVGCEATNDLTDANVTTRRSTVMSPAGQRRRATLGGANDRGQGRRGQRRQRRLVPRDRDGRLRLRPDADGAAGACVFPCRYQRRCSGRGAMRRTRRKVRRLPPRRPPWRGLSFARGCLDVEKIENRYGT